MWPDTPPLRVLIADDDERYAELVAGLLHRAAELEVVGIAKDGEEAVQLACWQDADIVVMDVEMPKIDGITATRLVRAAPTRPASRRRARRARPPTSRSRALPPTSCRRCSRSARAPPAPPDPAPGVAAAAVPGYRARLPGLCKRGEA
jgi:CheY-like chemotaxis protein